MGAGTRDTPPPPPRSASISFLGGTGLLPKLVVRVTARVTAKLKVSFNPHFELGKAYL